MILWCLDYSDAQQYARSAQLNIKTSKKHAYPSKKDKNGPEHEPGKNGSDSNILVRGWT